MFKQKLRREFLSLAFAVVFMPPTKETEDWSTAFPSKELHKESLQESAGNSSSKSSSPAAAPHSRFSFNGIDKITFALSAGEKPQWEISLPPVEFYKIWDTGAWSGLSLSAHELHHFYVREHKHGSEAKYRVYSFGNGSDIVDLASCSKKEIFILEKLLTAKQSYRITRIEILSSQELKRNASWIVESEVGQDFLSLKSDNCFVVDLEGWPKSFRVKL